MPRMGRLQFLDLARGAAVCGMVGYHFCWDLVWFGHASQNFVANHTMEGAAVLIALCFTVVSGMAFQHCHGARRDLRRGLVRIIRLALVATLVSLVTYAIDPRFFVRFGILHMIAVSSLVAMGCVGVPRLVLAGLVAGLVLAGLVLAHPWLAHLNAGNAGLAAPLFWSVGIGAAPPAFDYTPLIPWSAGFLGGMLAWRLVVPRPVFVRLGAWQAASPAARSLCCAGRHSLAIYLIHQPVLFAAFAMVALID